MSHCLKSNLIPADDDRPYYSIEGRTRFGGTNVHDHSFLDLTSALAKNFSHGVPGETRTAGISFRPGPHSSSPAVLFSSLSGPGDRRHVKVALDDVLDGDLTATGGGSDLSILTSLRQRRGNTGTILMLSDPDGNSLLEVQSSGRRDVLRVRYNDNTAVESIPLALADDTWHRLAITVSGEQMTVFLDCK